MPKFFDRCCNPMNTGRHKVKSSLRKLPEYLRIRYRLSMGNRVCTACYKKLLARYNQNDYEETIDDVQESRSTSPLSELSADITLPATNEALSLLNQSPIPAKKIIYDTYLNDKITRVAQNMRKALGVKNNVNYEYTDADAADIIDKLKCKFNDDDTSRSSRIQILTLLPTSWSVNKVVEVMGASEHMVRVAKNLVTDKGILSTPAKKIGKSENQ